VSAYLVDGLSMLMIWRESEDMLKVVESLVHVVFVVQTQSSHVHRVHIHPIKPQQVTANTSSVHFHQDLTRKLVNEELTM